MKKITRIFSLLMMLTLAIVLVACGGDPVEISFEQEYEVINVDEAKELAYNVSDETLELEWSSEDETIATVDQNGVVTGISPGSTVIKVEVKGKDVSATIEIDVEEIPEVLPTSISINAPVTEGKVGETHKFTAIVLPAGADQAVTWKSSNTSVVTISDEGVAELLSVGISFITATSVKDDSLSYEVQLEVFPPDPESLVISTDTGLAETQIFESVQFSATASPDMALSTVTWSVDNEDLATINENGLLTAHDEGVVIVTATSTIIETVSEDFELTITRPAPSIINVTGQHTIIDVEEELQLTVSVEPVKAVQEVVFTSSDDSIATVSETGLVTGVAAGTVTITITSAKDAEVKVTYEVTVVDTASIEFDPSKILLDQNLDVPRFGSVTIDEVEYYIGLNAFTNAPDAFAALEENATLLVLEGEYAGGVTIKANGVTVVGPNAGIPAGKDLSNRVNEAVFSGVITLDGVSDILLDGIAITGVAQIRSTKPVKNITIDNLNSFSPSVPSGEGVIYAGLGSSDHVNENYVVKNSSLVSSLSASYGGGYRGVRVNNAKNITITNNFFGGFYDSIRLEAEGSATTGTGATGDILIEDNIFENNFQYSVWIGRYYEANILVDNNYIASRPEFSGVYGHVYVYGFRATDGAKSVVNVTNNEMPYKVATWHQLRFHSNGATNEQLEINVNYNIFHEPAGQSTDGETIYTHISNHFDDENFVINAANNYYLYEGDVKPEYFLGNVTYEPLLRELPPQLVLDALVKDIETHITYDYQLPTADGVVWSLKEGEATDIYDVENGELLKFVTEQTELVVVAKLGDASVEVTLTFGVFVPGATQYYYNANEDDAAMKNGTFETQLATAGFNGYSIIVGDKQYFLGMNSYVPLSIESEDEVLSFDELRPFGNGFPEGRDAWWNVGIGIGGIPSTNSRGHGVLYENTGDLPITFVLGETYGRNESTWAGYGKVPFIPLGNGKYEVLEDTKDTGAYAQDGGTEYTIQPGEMLWAPHTWERDGTNLFAPRTDSGDYSHGVLAEGTVIEIIKFKTDFPELVPTFPTE